MGDEWVIPPLKTASAATFQGAEQAERAETPGTEGSNPATAGRACETACDTRAAGSVGAVWAAASTPIAPPGSATPAATAATVGDVVEVALADALRGAAAAHEWPVVQQLARELEARRLARSAPDGGYAAGVVELEAARRGRRGGPT